MNKSIVIIIAWFVFLINFLGIRNSLALLESTDLCGPYDAAFLRSHIPKNGIVVIGEVHGTKQVPQFVYSLVCELGRAGNSIALALEISVDEMDAIEAILPPSVTDTSARGIVSERSFWSNPEGDGRSSGAMLELILRTKALRNKGYPVDLAMMDISYDAWKRTDSRPDRDAFMAARLSDMANLPYDYIIALTGRVHARKDAGRVGERLHQGVRIGDRLLILEAVAGAGDFWGCMGENAQTVTCGIKDMAAVDPPSNPDCETLCFEHGPLSGFEGRLFFRHFTASSPVGITAPVD